MEERHLLLSRAHELNAQKTIIQLNLIEKGKKGEKSSSPHLHTHTHTPPKEWNAYKCYQQFSYFEPIPLTTFDCMFNVSVFILIEVRYKTEAISPFDGFNEKLEQTPLPVPMLDS